MPNDDGETEGRGMLGVAGYVIAYAVLLITGGGASGLFGIEAIIRIGRLHQTVLIAAELHELPHPTRSRTGNGAGLIFYPVEPRNLYSSTSHEERNG